MKKLPLLLFLCLSLTAVGTVALYSAPGTVGNKLGWFKRLIVGSLVSDIYAAPNGIGNGSFANPTSFSNALYLASQRIGVKRVWLRGGSYTNVALTIQDTNLSVSAYPGETPTLVGGQYVSGGTVGGGVTTYALPTYPASVTASGISHITNWTVRMLCAPTGMLTWASYGPFYHTNATDDGVWDLTHRSKLEKMTNDWTGLDTTNAELALDSSFLVSFTAITNNDVGNRTFYVSPIFWSPPGYGAATTYNLWNLTNTWSANQWVQDRVNNRILVRSSTPVTLVVPTTTRILYAQNCKNVTLKGLQLSVTTVNTVDGRVYCTMVDSALTLTNCIDCTLDGLTVANVGGNAIDVLADNNTRITIKNCVVDHAGGTGILAASNGSSYEHRPVSLVITNNLVHDTGLVRHSGVGIIGGDYLQGNTISNTAYSGIVCVKDGSLVESNRIQNAMSVMRDGGGIHIATCTNVITRYNWLSDITQNSTQGGELDRHQMAIYNENYVSANAFSNNLMTGCFFSLQCIASFDTNCVWNNNVAINNTVGKGLLVNFQRGLLAYPTNNTLTNNIFYGPGGVEFLYTNIILSALSNIVYVGGSASTNLPFNTVLADPGLVSLTSPNVQYTPGGAAAVAGMTPFDLSNAGYHP